MRRHRIHLGDDARDVAHKLGAVVYLKVARERDPGMVTGYFVDADSVMYQVSWASAQWTRHYEAELTGRFDPDGLEPGGEGGADA